MPGRLVEPPPYYRDRVGMALSHIMGAGEFEKRVGELTASEDRPWAEVSGGYEARRCWSTRRRSLVRRRASPWRRSKGRSISAAPLRGAARLLGRDCATAFGPPGINPSNPAPSYLTRRCRLRPPDGRTRGPRRDYKQLGARCRSAGAGRGTSSAKSRSSTRSGWIIKNLELEAVEVVRADRPRVLDMTRVPDGSVENRKGSREAGRLSGRSRCRASRSGRAWRCPSDLRPDDRRKHAGRGGNRRKDRNQDIDL